MQLLYTLCVCVKVNDVEELTPESFTLFHLIEPQIGKRLRRDHISLTRPLLSDLLVLGTGSKVKKINPIITSYLHRKGISLEIQDTVSHSTHSLLIITLSLSLCLSPSA